MAIDFPNNPNDGDTYTFASQTWVYRNPPGVWKPVGTYVSLTGPTGSGATGPTGTTYWTQTGANIYYTTGNVGIGTTGPSYPLQVAGQEIAIGTGDAQEKRLRFYNSYKNAYLYQNSSSQFGYYDASSSATRWYNDSSGNFYAQTNFIISSDERLKTNIQPVTGMADIVDQVDAKTFVRTDIDNQETQLGFIAQDLEKVLPLCIAVDNQGMLTVKQMPLIAALWQALKETREQLQSLQAKLDQLKN